MVQIPFKSHPWPLERYLSSYSHYPGYILQMMKFYPSLCCFCPWNFSDSSNVHMSWPMSNTLPILSPAFQISYHILNTSFSWGTSDDFKILLPSPTSPLQVFEVGRLHTIGFNHHNKNNIYMCFAIYQMPLCLLFYLIFITFLWHTYYCHPLFYEW